VGVLVEDVRAVHVHIVQLTFRAHKFSTFFLTRSCVPRPVAQVRICTQPKSVPLLNCRVKKKGVSLEPSRYVPSTRFVIRLALGSLELVTASDHYYHNCRELGFERPCKLVFGTHVV
jgi:hypothetical protein